MEAAAKEMQALVEMDIGVQLTEQQAHEVIKSGAKILRSKMVYKRKYGISETDGKEYFLKWKGRLAIVGTGETEGEHARHVRAYKPGIMSAGSATLRCVK